MMQKYHAFFKHYPDLGLFLVRLAIGLVFVVHGWSKVTGIEGTIGFFGMLGLPAFVAYLVAFCETVGGLLMLLGLWVEVAGWTIVIIMLNAIFLAKASKGFTGGYEFDLTLLLAAAGIALLGAGKLSVQSYLAKAPKTP